MNNYKLMLPNKKIAFIKKKDDYKPDPKITDLFYTLEKNKFNRWLNSPLEEKDVLFFNNRLHNKGSYIYDDNNEIVQKNRFVTHFIDDLKIILTNQGYVINNNKVFRDDITNFIYNNSK